MNELYGVDVSEFQGQIDWDALNAVANFVIMRASFGTLRKDYQFDRNVTEARRVQAAAGPLGIGFYYYGYPTLVDAVTSADYFIGNLGQLHDGDVLALDLEGDIGPDPVGWSLRFLQRCEELTGVKPLTYLNQSEKSGYDWSPVVAGSFGLWEAQYSGDKTTVPNPTPWQVVAGRQWSSSDIVAGIANKVDGDTFYGDMNTWNAYGYHTPVPTPPVPGTVIQPDPTTTTTTTEPEPSTATTTTSTTINEEPPMDTTTSTTTETTTAPPLPPTPPVIKPGFQTTEFYITLVALALPAINHYFNSQLSLNDASNFVMALVSVVGAVVAAVTYITGRNSLKLTK